TFYNRNNYYRGGAERGGVNGYHGEVNGNHGGVNGYHGEADNHPAATPRPFDVDPQAARGYAEPRGQSGTHSDTFSGYDHGGQEKGFASRGGDSFGGGGGFHGGGGGGGGG